MALFKVSFFSLSSCTGYKNLPKIPQQVITICSIKLGYCLPYCFLGIFGSLIISKQGIEMQVFFKQVVEILEKWSHPCHVTIECPPPSPGLSASYILPVSQIFTLYLVSVTRNCKSVTSGKSKERKELISGLSYNIIPYC